MKPSRLILLVLLALVAALPAGAAIKPATLSELMELTDEAVHGRIVAKETFRHDFPIEGGVYTRLTIEGASLRAGAGETFTFVFMGSHDPGDAFTMSEMPPVRDVRPGTEVIVFSERSPQLDGRNLLHNLSNVYRVERGFGEAVVIGKGKGLAFPQNVRLDEASQRIRDVDSALRARAAAQPQAPGN